MDQVEARCKLGSEYGPIAWALLGYKLMKLMQINYFVGDY